MSLSAVLACAEVRRHCRHIHILLMTAAGNLRHSCPLQAPHELLNALASLGVRSASAQHGDDFLGRLISACRTRLLDADNSGLAPINAAWALAAMQARVSGAVPSASTAGRSRH